MKKNIYIVAIGIILALSGCSDKFFELDRPPQNPWNTVEEFERAAIGAYGSLFGGDQWNIPWVNWAVVKTSMGDDVNWVNNGEWGYWRRTKEFNIYTDKNILLLYRTVASVNDALEFVNSHNGNPYPTETQANIENNFKRIVGELHFIRGYAYYLLITTFGKAYVPGGDNSGLDIPIPTEFAKSITEAKNPKIGTTKEVYDLILSDFMKAKELLPNKYLEGQHHPSYQVRANKYAAAGMLVRTYFQRGEYAQALAECNFIIDQNNGEYDLSEEPIEAFNKSSLTRGKEVIFFAPYFDEALFPPLHLTVLNHNAGPWGQCNWNETMMGKGTIQRLGWMNDPVNDTTINVAAKRDKRFRQLYAVRYPISKAKPGQATDNRTEINNITTIWPNKFFRGPKQFNTNVPLIRLAEIYLTRSIIRLRNGDKTGSASDLNIVRARAWDVNIGGPFVPITAENITEQMINDERLIELFNESDRIDYLRGLKVEIPKGERGVGTDPYTSEDFIWDIPVRETLYNESLKNK